MAEATATGTTTSTFGTNHEGMPTGLYKPTGNPGSDAAEVTGTTGFDMSFLWKQHVYQNGFTWSSSDRTGTILWRMPLSPMHSNSIVRHMAKIHNVWKGGFSIEMLCAGTGFNGGKFAVVYLPPNFDPSALSVTNLTCFPYVVFDPKENNILKFTTMDMCVQKAHWMDHGGKTGFTKDKLEEYAKTGGTLCAFVLNPLINSSGAATKVNISVMSALAPGFTMNQIVPPQDDHGGASDLAFPSPRTYSNGKIRAIPVGERFIHEPSLLHSRLEIKASSEVAQGDHYTLIDYTTGEYMYSPASERFYWSDLQFTNRIGSKDAVANCTVKNENSGKFAFYAWRGDVATKPCTGYTGAFGKKIMFEASAYSNQDHITPRNQVIHVYPAQNRSGENAVFTAVKSDLGESIVTFGPSEATSGVFMTHELANFFSWPRCEPGQDLVFALRSQTTNRPAVYLRLSQLGCFTSQSVTTAKYFNLADYYLTYENVYPSDSVLNL